MKCLPIHCKLPGELPLAPGLPYAYQVTVLLLLKEGANALSSVLVEWRGAVTRQLTFCRAASMVFGPPTHLALEWHGGMAVQHRGCGAGTAGGAHRTLS